MSNEYYMNMELGLNEARSILNQRNADELKKLMQNDEELMKLITNISEVGYSL